MRFLRPSPTAPAWAFESAARSLNRMGATVGRPLTLHAALSFVSRYPLPPRHINDENRCPRIFVGDAPNAVSYCEETGYKTQLLKSTPWRPTPDRRSWHRCNTSASYQ